MNRPAIVDAGGEVDNTRPFGPPTIFTTMDIHISAGQDGKDFDLGSAIIGTLIADDLRFCGSSLSTEPTTFNGETQHERHCDH